MGKNATISTLPNISQNYLPKINTSGIFANTLVYDDGSSVLINTTTASAFRLDVNGTGRFQGALTGTSATFSGNVGIGGGTPSIFTAYSVASFGSLSTTNNGITIASTTAGNGLIEFADGTVSNQAYRGYIQYSHSADAMYLAAANNVALTLASTGAATFSSSVTATQFAAGSASPTYAFNSISAAGTQALLNSTRLGGGGIILQNNGVDSLYLGTANWAGISGFGTSATDITLMAAANSSAIVFATGTASTERMRITSGGNVGINNTTPASYYSNQFVVGAGNENGITIACTNTTSENYLMFADGTAGADAYRGFIGYNHTGNYLRFGSDGATRMTITSGGNVAINNNLAVGRAEEAGVRLSVTSSGTSSAAYSIICRDSSGNDLFVLRNDGYMLTGTRAFSPYNNTSGVAANMVVGADGTLYRSTSSLKYKTNVKAYNRGLNEVMQLNPVYYNSKNEKEQGIQFAGLIAEEVHELGLTEFVQYAEDGSPDALAYQNMVALLTKAIQELNQKITLLENK